jgi:peptidoglycan/LPS O-acetylase OafA/YrhL
VRAPVRLPYVGALDGLRGVAVAAVVAFHAEAGWARGGFLGVSAFFTLSGFLITSLLLAERRDTGRVDLRRFWARRARRLVPASLLALALIVVLTAATGDGSQTRGLRGDVLAAITNVANWRFLAVGRSYETLFTEPSPVQHFWSLAIEEQCYLVVPLVVVALLRLRGGRRDALAIGLFALTAASVLVGVVVSSPALDSARVYYGTDTRAAELLVGALLAVAVHGRRPSRAGRAAISVAGVGALGIIAWWWSTVSRGDAWLYDGGLLAHAALTAVVLLAATVRGPVAAVLSWRPFVGLGRISYGVYLYHWPLFLWLDASRTGLDGPALHALRLGTTLAVATASYVLVEQPIRTGRRVTIGTARVALPAAAASVVLTAVAVTAAAPAPEIVFEAVSATAPPRVLGSPVRDRHGEEARRITRLVRSDLHRPLETRRPLRVLVVGDSVAVTVGRGLERWGATSGDAAVWNLARFYCAIGRGAERTVGVGVQRQEACDDWGERWGDAVSTFDPDTVVVLSTFWELIARRADGWADWGQPGERVYDEWQLDEYTDAVDLLSSRGARVVWLTMPCFSTTTDSSVETITRYNAVQLGRLRSRRPEAVRVVDLFGEVCPDGTFTPRYDDIVDARPDGAHFSDDGADALAGWLGPLLLGRTPAVPSAAPQ